MHFDPIDMKSHGCVIARVVQLLVLSFVFGRLKVLLMKCVSCLTCGYFLEDSSFEKQCRRDNPMPSFTL